MRHFSLCNNEQPTLKIILQMIFHERDFMNERLFAAYINVDQCITEFSWFLSFSLAIFFLFQCREREIFYPFHSQPQQQLIKETLTFDRPNFFLLQST